MSTTVSTGHFEQGPPLCCLLSVSLKTPVKFPHNEMKAKEKSEEPRCANFEENEYHVNKYFPPKNSSSQIRSDQIGETERPATTRWSY